MEQQVIHGIQQTEPVALWVLGVIIFGILSITGFMLGVSYKGIIKRLDSLEAVLKEISSFISKQSEKNDKYEETKRRVDVLEDKVLKLEDAHFVCPQYPLRRVP